MIFLECIGSRACLSAERASRNGQQTDKKLQINDLWLFLLPESPASKTSKVR